MRILVFSFYSLFFAVFGVINAGCYAHANGAGIAVGIETHDSRWHYDHDYDDNYRQSHSYARWDYDTNRDDQYRHDHPWHEDQ